MRHLIKFESFRMNKENCDRCGEATGGSTIMSIFNQDVICMPCKEEEKLDPDYNIASLAELQAMRDGIVDFPGAFPDYKPLKRKH
jgi:ArsR family metal-binding transcriptional regulator